MRIHSFRVVPALPERLQGLHDIAYNLLWSWDDDLRVVFSRLDRDLWDKTYQNPVLMLGTIAQERLEALARDESFLSYYDRALERLRAYLREPTWWDRRLKERPLVAYFSAEFGLAECLPIYSGGLGVLAGHHLKSASDLGVPLVGVGLLYQQGYFRQYLTSDGWQQESYPVNDFYNVPVQLATGPDGVAGAHRDRPRRPAPPRPGVARRGGTRAAVPPRHQPAREPARPPGHHRPALRRRPGEPHPPGDRAGHRRPARAARRGPRPGGLPHERGALRVPRPRAHPRPRAGAGAVLRGGPGGHAAPGRSSPPTPRCRPASTCSRPSSWTSTSAPSCARSGPRAPSSWPWAAPPARTTRPVQHGGPGAAHLRLCQRRERAARRGLAPAARRPTCPGCPSTRCRSGHVTNGAHTRSCVSRDMAGLFDRYLSPPGRAARV